MSDSNSNSNSDSMVDVEQQKYVTNVKALDGRSQTIWFNNYDDLYNQSIILFNLDPCKEIYFVNMGYKMTKESATHEVLLNLRCIATIHIVVKL